MIELLQPAFLWVAALALPLVALYLLKARRVRHEVSASWLWEEAQRELEARVPLRRLRRDWLLLLQLLALLLLAVAAAGPFRRALLAPGGDTAVVVDVSASLAATGRPEELARAVGRWIDGKGAGDRLALVRAGSQIEIVAPLTDDADTLRRAAVDLVPQATATNLEAALELAEGLVGDHGVVVVVTDPSGEVPARMRDGVLRVVRVGEPAANVGLVALGVRATNSSGRHHEIFARLLNAAPGTAHGTLRLLADGTLRDAAALEIAPRAEAVHTLRLEGMESARLEVEWSPKATPSGAASDALALDDRAAWILEPAQERRYRVHGTADPYLRRALAASDGWSEAGVEVDGEADLDVVIGEAPEQAEGPPFLWIAPRGALNGRDLVAEDVKTAAILDWDATHPALRFVDLRGVRLGRIPRLVRPLGVRVLATSSAGPWILEGRLGERPYLLWAFDPLDTDLPLRVAFPLLVRHALEHLVPATGGRAEGLLDARESNLEAVGATGGQAVALDDEHAAVAPRSTLRGLWRPLALLALALLVFEAMAFHRRWTL